MRSTGSFYDVLGDDGKVYVCRIRGKFRLQGLRTTNPVAVGDRVVIEPDDQENAIITGLEPRENYIIRQSVHKKESAHILAANLDQAMLIVTLHYPRTSLGFIDRFLVTAESFRIPQVLVFNKADLLEGKKRSKQQEIVEIYREVGIPCLITSALRESGIDDLRKILQNKTTLIAGHSGVGKSTLINLLDPEIRQETGAVSDFANKGVHTTTFAEMFSLDNESAWIIDTPGIKELGLVDMDPAEISDYFPEMRALQGQCKFHNCLHLNEPRCAVKQAVDDSEIAESRYASYLSMLEGGDNRR